MNFSKNAFTVGMTAQFMLTGAWMAVSWNNPRLYIIGIVFIGISSFVGWWAGYSERKETNR